MNPLKGIKFIIVVVARAGKFNIVPLLITIGSGIGLLSIATIIADLAISSFSKEKQIYNELILLDTKQDGKTLHVTDADLDADVGAESSPPPPPTTPKDECTKEEKI